MQRELSCVYMRCSMQTRFANAAQHADAFFVIRAISTVKDSFRPTSQFSNGTHTC